MSKRASQISIVLAIIGALGGGVLIVARAPRSAAASTPSAVYGH